MNNLDEAKKEILSRLEELKVVCATGNAWVFVCAAALLDYLSRLVNGENKGAQGYKDFVTTWMSQVNNKYSNFTYINGKSDLSVQMYHVLRCGLVHSLSLIPDPKAVDRGGRDRSIVLCHRAESIEKGLPHLSPYNKGVISDAAVFVAEEFINDIEEAIKLIFIKAKQDAVLKDNILKWLSQHPIIIGGY